MNVTKDARQRKEKRHSEKAVNVRISNNDGNRQT